eukprot:GFUD01122022.1.p1 GENE.GFUD01122022.1~~GFUD01122022.1.p1  ORF type:complete len:175 (+),score=70.57 GFUD01122022.1:10-534(+)
MENKSQATLVFFLSLTSILQAQPIIIVLGGQTQAAFKLSDFLTLETIDVYPMNDEEIIASNEDDTKSPTDDSEIVVVNIDEDENDSVWSKIKEDSEGNSEIFLVDIKEESLENNDEIMATEIQEISTAKTNYEMENVENDDEIVTSDDPIEPASFRNLDINEKVEGLQETESVE